MLNAATPDPRSVPAVPQEVKKLHITKKSNDGVFAFLQLPLFGLEEESTGESQELEAKLPAPDTVASQLSLASAVAVGLAVEQEPDEAIEWTVEEIIDLHANLLEMSLKVLAARGNAHEKLDVLHWIYENDYVGEVEKNTPYGKRKFIVTNRDVPFSFAFCCRLEGHDPESYRSHLRNYLPPELVSRFISNDYVSRSGQKAGHNLAAWEIC